jgi:DNA-binding IclR family transcriptional regulator
MGEHSKSFAKTTVTSLQVIEAIRELDGATATELTEHLELAPSTVHRHLATLRKYGYIVQEDDRYQIGLQFLTLGGYRQRQYTDYPMIKEKVDQLAADTGERAQFIVEEHGERVYLYTEVGESAVQTGAHVGKRGKIHTSAAGKAILAQLSQERVSKIIEQHGLGDGAGLTTEKELYDRLETIRDRGYAFNRQETTSGVHAVGAPVTNEDDVVLGALSISGPANRMNGDKFTQELPDRILGAVNELELHIEHSV